MFKISTNLFLACSLMEPRLMTAFDRFEAPVVVETGGDEDIESLMAVVAGDVIGDGFAL